MTEEYIAADGNHTALPQDQTRWSVWSAFVTAGFCPKTTAMRTAHAGFVQAYLVHLLSIPLAVLLIVFLTVLVDQRGAIHPLLILDEMLDAVLLLKKGFVQDPFWTSVGCGAAFGGIELLFLLGAIIVMPWGARDERLRLSFGSALRRGWLYSPHVLLLILLPGLLSVELSRASRAWMQEYYIPATCPTLSPPTTPTNQSLNSPEWQEYQAQKAKYDVAVAEYHKTSQELWETTWRNRPWLLRYRELLMVWSVILVVCWGLWAWLRSVGAPRAVLPISRPPQCEACGYNLMYAPLEGRCPECGEAVSASLGPLTRPGSPWQQRIRSNRLDVYWRCVTDPIIRPRAFGRSLRICTPTTAHRGFMAIHLLLVFVVAAIGVIACMVASDEFEAITDPIEIIWASGTTGGFTFVVITLLLSLATAVAVAIGYHFTDKRNLMPGTMQAVAYLGGYLVLWATAAVATALVITIAMPWVRAFAKFLDWNCDMLCMICWLLPNLLLLFHYVRLVVRITAGARYANR
ncbi:MAG: hypothetical protein KAV82_16745 [Phycisphaerae bacterium]|nr:hypothetical protein [Phycisphaerae bacterium]